MVAYVLVALVAALHVCILYLEMIAWDTPAGRKVFGTTPEFSKASKTLASTKAASRMF